MGVSTTVCRTLQQFIINAEQVYYFQTGGGIINNNQNLEKTEGCTNKRQELISLL